MIFYLHPEVKQHLSSQHLAFDQMMAFRGETFRELENRRTQRIILGHKTYFIKQHFGIGWKEIFKNLFQWRLPIYSAKNEWQAIQKLHSLNIAAQKIVGYGARGSNPAHIQSFIMTEELPQTISLEDFCKPWRSQPPSFRLKYQLICDVARIARTLHSNGLNHRDFYLCHFLMADNYSLHLIDLHRAQIRNHTPMRWIIKDLAGLYFSSKEIGLTSRDLLRFMKEYRNKSLNNLTNKESVFWQKVKQRGDKLYQQHAN